VVKGGASATRVEKRIVITADSEDDQVQYGVYDGSFYTHHGLVKHNASL
jgi:hypothetical protein